MVTLAKYYLYPGISKPGALGDFIDEIKCCVVMEGWARLYLELYCHVQYFMQR